MRTCRKVCGYLEGRAVECARVEGHDGECGTDMSGSHLLEKVCCKVVRVERAPENERAWERTLHCTLVEGHDGPCAHAEAFHDDKTYSASLAWDVADRTFHIDREALRSALQKSYERNADLLLEVVHAKAEAQHANTQLSLAENAFAMRAAEFVTEVKRLEEELAPFRIAHFVPRDALEKMKDERDHASASLAEELSATATLKAELEGATRERDYAFHVFALLVDNIERDVKKVLHEAYAQMIASKGKR